MNSRKPGTRNRSQWMRLSGISLVAAACALLPTMSMAGEHPEHPKSGDETAAKEVTAKKGKLDAAAEEVAAKKGKLDGKSFAGELVEKGKTSGDGDEFVFEQGKFLSTACFNHGFGKADYVATEQDGVIEFTSETRNASKENMSWKGTVKGDQIKGTVLHQSGAKQTEYRFKGSLKPAAAAAVTPSTEKSEQPKQPEQAEQPEQPKQSEQAEQPKQPEHPEHQK